MFGLGTTEIVLILIIVVVLFGGKRIPQLGRGLAEGIRNFRKGLKDNEDSDEHLVQTPDKKDKDETDEG